MNSFDDSIPEEVELEQQQLFPLLQHAYPRLAPLTTAEQEQILGRVRERLLNLPLSLTAEDAPIGDPPIEEDRVAGQSSPPPSGERVPRVDRSRRARIFQMLNSLAAVLILGAIVVAALLLFSHRPQSQPATGGTNGTILAAYSAAGGLEMSLYLTPGPYFLSEMLAADISLTNQSNTSYYIGIPFTVSPCGYVTGINTSGGKAPHYNITIATDHSCPPSRIATELKPGQTLTTHKYLPLTDSGYVVLTAEAEFLTKNLNNGFEFYTSTSSPLDKHWPSIQINVGSNIPADRQLSYRIQGIHVIVNAPPAARSHLVYLYDIGCQDFNDSGTTGTGNFGWESIPTNQVALPGCPGKNPQWSFAFAAPGYAIVMGNYPPAAKHS